MPALIRRAEWQWYPNGAGSIREFVFCGENGSAALDPFGRPFGPGLTKIPDGYGFDAGEGCIMALSPNAASKHYGADALLPQGGKT